MLRAGHVRPLPATRAVVVEHVKVGLAESSVDLGNRQRWDVFHEEP
jgi:hypothetical protein